MDQRERANDYEAALRAALSGLQADVWTALPGIVESYDPATLTASVQPAVQGRQLGRDEKWSSADLPLLVSCPVLFPGGGGFTLTFPLAKDDEVLVVFASRCIDAWLDQGGVQVQSDLRMHDMSDGFCIPRVWSRPNRIADVSATNVQLRSDDGETFLDMTPEGVATVKAASIVLDGSVHCTGNLQVDGGLVDGTGTPTTFSTHTHSAVQVGGGVSGPPVPGS